MILQALKGYYDRKAADPDSDIAPEGFEKRELPFLIVIDQNGKFVELEDTREKVGKKMVGKVFLLPRSKPRSGVKGHETVFFLWDHLGYVLSYPEDDPKASKQHTAWMKQLDELPDSLKCDVGINAITRFYKTDGKDLIKASSAWKECAALPSCNIAFRLAGDLVPVPCRPAIQKHLQDTQQSVTLSDRDNGDDIDETESSVHVGRCLITGEVGEIARIHGNTPISKDSKKLVGFQKNSGYDSYGKEQAYNAPVSKTAEFAYTTALNMLLKSDRSRMLVGDAVTLFWSEKPTDLENQLVDIFGEPPKDDPDAGVKAVKSLFMSVENGTLAVDAENTRFYVLGMSPNAARISIRFWIVDTVAGMAKKIIQHFEDLSIAHGPRDRDTLSLFRLLVSIAVLGKSENIPPNIAGDTMRTILEGLPYPETLLQAAIRRIRADHDISYARASIIKGYINRKTRFYEPENKEELKVSLDLNNDNIGYRLGRLFATLEKIQSEANPGINATIRDRFYGAASGTPVAVFSNLMRLKNHHLSKLDSQGRRVYFERLIAEIMYEVSDFPAHLSLSDQGRFAIGYYHQVQAFYTKKNSEIGETVAQTEGEENNE